MKRIFSLVAAVMMLGALHAGAQAIDAFPRTTTIGPTDLLLTQTNSSGAAGQKFTRGISWSNVLESLMDFPNWPSSSSFNLTNLVIIAPGPNAVSNGQMLTNILLSMPVGSNAWVMRGRYDVQTNLASLMRNGINVHVEDDTVINSGIAADAEGLRHLFHDYSGAITSTWSGGGIYTVSNDVESYVLHQTNPLSKIHFTFKKVRAATEYAAIKHSGGELVLKSESDGGYADGYDFYINEDTNRTSRLFVEMPNAIGDTNSGDSSFEFAGQAFARPGDCVIRVGYARGDLTIPDNGEIQIKALDLGRENLIYSAAHDTGSGILRNTEVYGTTNRSFPLIAQPNGYDGLFRTAGTFENVRFRGATNRPIAHISNAPSSSITFIDCRFEDGWGATNSIRSANAQSVTLANVQMSLGLHANVSQSSATNYSSAVRVAKVLNTGTTTNTGEMDQTAVARFFQGIDVTGDINTDSLLTGTILANGQIAASGGLGLYNSVTVSRVLMLNADGDVTNVTSSSPSTEYVKADGTVGTPSGGSGTNNPVLSASPTIAIIANQTARAMFTTNAPFAWTITGASNQSTVVEVELANTSTNTIYATNALAPHVVEYGSNVTTLAIAPTSKLITRSWLNRSNEWVMTTFGAPYALTFSGAGVTMTTNHTTKTVDAAISGSGGSGSSVFNETNITVSTTNEIVIDPAAFDVVKVKLLTNLNSVIYTNVASMTRRSHVYWQQDTNGVRTVLNNRVSGGLIQTNANLQPTTNANAVDLLELMPGFFSTNLFAWWPQNFQPRVAFTNSLDDGVLDCSASGQSFLTINGVTASAADYYASGFVSDGQDICKVELLLSVNASETASFFVELRSAAATNSPSQTVLATSDTKTAAQITTSTNYVTFSFPSTVSTASGSTNWWVVRKTSASAFGLNFGRASGSVNLMKSSVDGVAWADVTTTRQGNFRTFKP